jgi:hypothetical protein
MLAFFGYISGILSVLCYLPYIRDILLGKTKPERASWFIWSVLGSIAFFSQLSKGASYSLWLPGVQTPGVLLVFLLSLKFGVGGLQRNDSIALLIAGGALALWYLTKEAALALYLVLLIDSTGAVLTLHKAYDYPESETLSTWVLAGLAGLFATLAVGRFDVILLSYPLYTFGTNVLIVSAIFLGFQRKK